MTMRTLTLTALLGAALGPACDYVATNEYAVAPNNVISGSVVIDGLDTAHNTVVLLFAADALPPPAGTGRPITFDGISATDYTVGNGLLSAPFAITNLPDGEYAVAALVDVDDNFQPLVTAFAGSSCGDWLGTYTDDLTVGGYSTVRLDGGILADNITVFVNRENTLQRPAFHFEGGRAVVVREDAIGAPLPPTFDLVTTAVHSVWVDQDGDGEDPDTPGEQHFYDLEGPFDVASPDTCDTAFWVWFADSDEDGTNDPHPDYPPDAGIGDAWPRLYLEYKGIPQGDGTFQLDLEPGERWVGQAIPDPRLLTFGTVPLGVPTPMTDLTAVWIPGARHEYADGTEDVITDPLEIPAGAWSVTAVQLSGQTWPMPNETVLFGSSDPSFDPSLQGSMLILE